MGVVDRMEKAGERQKKESSESEEVEKERKGRREVENKKEGKGKGKEKEVVQREGRKRMSKVENSEESVGVAMTVSPRGWSLSFSTVDWGTDPCIKNDRKERLE